MGEIKKQNFLDEALSDGEVTSYGRLGSFIALVFACLWITILVLRVQDMAKDLPAISIFIAAAMAFVAALYGLSKGGDVLEAIKTAPKTGGQ